MTTVSPGEETLAEVWTTQPISIPVSNSADLFLEIFPEELPDTRTSTLVQILKDEKAPVILWVEIAAAYMGQGKPQDALTILEECPVDEDDESVHQARLFAATGIALLTTAQSSSDPEELRQSADSKLTQASKLETFFPMTWMARGLWNLWVSSKLEQARFFFQMTLKECGPVLPALMGLAAVFFTEGQYKAAQQQYSSIIRRYPQSSGPAARVGLALASYKLGQVDRAKAALKRALEIDPEYVPALASASVLALAQSPLVDPQAPSSEEAIKQLSVANLLDPSNAMVQNHLANHYFWKWAPVAGSVQVTQGSTKLIAQSSLQVDPRERIRLGPRFETVLVSDGENGEWTMADPWPEKDATLQVWKKDYDRVISLAKGAYGASKHPGVQAESLLCLGRVYHVREEHANAHKFYAKAIQLAPDLTPARFGLAQILITEKKFDQAMTELKKVLVSSPQATDAAALLGLLQTRSTDTLDEGLSNLRKACELEPFEPKWVQWEALAMQGHAPLSKKALERYEKATELLSTKNRQTDTNILVNSGVLCHNTRQWDRALEKYKEALLSLDKDGSMRKATMESLGQPGASIRDPDNNMFTDYVDSGVKVSGSSADDEADWLDCTVDGDAPFSEGDRIRVGNTFETKIVAVENSAPPRIQVSDALETKPEDETVFVVRENRLMEIPGAVTIAFNIARLHEATGNILAAVEIHKAIIKRHPGYVNSYLRLACIAVDSGALPESSAWLKLAYASTPGHPEVLTLIGNLHLSLCDWSPAQKIFDSLLANKVANTEAYAMLSMGNIYFANLKNNADKYEKHLKYAADYYKGVLGKDTLNAYAANGIGTVLGEKGELLKAKDAFNRVREVSGDTIADALLNLGHILLAQKSHPEALQMYTSYMKRTEDGSSPVASKSRNDDLAAVLNFVAFAYFDWARHTELANDPRAAPADGRFKEAMAYLEKAIALQSRNESSLRFNLCMVKLSAANCVLQKQTRNIPRTAEEVQEALDSLTESLTIVENMLKAKQEKDQKTKIQIASGTLQQFIKNCRDNIENAKSHLADELERAKEAEMERDLRRQAAEAAMKEAQILKQMKESDELKAQQERDAKAEQKMEKLQQLRVDWEQEQANKAALKEKRARKSKPDDGFLVEDEPDGDTGGATGQGLFDDSDDEEQSAGEPQGAAKEEGDPGAAAVKKSSLFDDSDDSDDDLFNSETKAAAPAKEATTTSQDLFGDSDDDDDEAPDTDKRDRDEEEDDDQPSKKQKVN